MGIRRENSIAVAVGACLLAATSAEGSFHLMQIEQVIGGVNGDVTEQAIQLRMRAANQNMVAQGRIRAWDAVGMNPVTIVNLGAAVPNGAVGSRVLITSPNFNDDTSPPAVANFTMTSLIPPSYLAAGSLTFESDSGIIYWRLSWGGANYTGPGTLNVANDSNGNASPPFPGEMPRVCTETLKFPGPATALSTTNLADYALSGAGAVFTNNAGATFTLGTAPIGACCLGDGTCLDAIHESDCAKFGGVSQGICTTCAQVECEVPAVGACCMTDGACVDGLTALNCALQSGTYQGDATTCAGVKCPPPVTGACCFGETCVPGQTFDQCTLAGGEYQGDSTACDVPCPFAALGACCLSGDDCAELLEPDCARAEGKFQGVGTLCADSCVPPCPADVTGDGVINVDDLLAVINGWGASGGSADVNADGAVNVDDLLGVINAWGPC